MDQKTVTFILPRTKNSGQDFAAGRILLLSFVLVIMLGTALLYLPASTKTPLTLWQAFFTATSTTCVTGLSITDITNFTRFGQLVLMILTQIGGLGLITLSFSMIYIFVGNLGFASRSLAGELLSFESFGRLRYFLISILRLTLFVELVGAISLYFQFKPLYPTSDAIFRAIFYSVSAFCNAGICLDNVPLVDNFGLGTTATLSFLSILGGLGFFFFYEIADKCKTFFSAWWHGTRLNPSHKRLSLNSKIILTSFFILTLIGMVGFLATEANHALINLSWPIKICYSFFYTTFTHSTGFFLVPLTSCKTATLMISLVFMLIGTAPGSTGGGIKTTTAWLFMTTIVSIVRGKKLVEISGRTLSEQQVYKTITIVTIAGFWIFLSTLLLALFDEQQNFFHLLFETTSALCTVGLSIDGLTNKLTMASQLVLVINMIAGRIGSLTFIYAIRQRQEKTLYKYPEERIILS